MSKRIGNQTVSLSVPPKISSRAAIVGPKEGKGPLGLYFDYIFEEELWGEKSWEKAESKLVKEIFSLLERKMEKSLGEINYLLAGDLMNQCLASNFGLRESNIPVFGVFGACSTMAETMGLGAMLVDGGFADNVACLTSSHFCTAEKQFRYPLELGNQRTPSAQWTVTGGGGVILSNKGAGIEIQTVTTGKIVDMGIKDANNMGAAMAPAAADTICAHFMDTGFPVEKYDLIITGDLGSIGNEICGELLRENGIDTNGRLNDCGLLIYDLDDQDVHSGGSGCGCSASVVAAYILREMEKGTYKNVLFAGTGALLNQLSVQQGETIPCISHVVSLNTK